MARALAGRWLSPDPLAGDITNPQSLNRYAYVLNNPTTLTDPLGLNSCTPANNNCDYGQSHHAPTCWGMVCADNPATYGGLPYPGYQNIGSQNPFDLQLLTICSSESCSDTLNFNNLDAANAAANSSSGGTPQPSNTPPTPIKSTTIGPAPRPKPQSQTPAQAATNYCQQHGQLSFNIPFTHVPVTVGFSATFFANFSTTNDIALTLPPSAGASLDITVGAPQGPNIPVQVGSGKNLSIGTFFTPSGLSGFSASFGPSAGSPVTFSPPVANACGLNAGGG